MAKKKRAQLEAWCWYCDREFEDDKVLLQHQKAKHYKCPYCPRRLNTAGGLTVHLHQVHKAEPTTIENALPGRDSFEIEIYGMVGIPETDLAEWRSRKAASGGNGNGSSQGQPAAKRQRIENVALTPEQLKAQLEAHKALMSGHAPPSGNVPRPGFPAGPPPPFPSYGPPPGFPRGPPPGLAGSPPPLPFAGPPPQSRSTATQYGGPPPNTSVSQPSPHQLAIKAGAKSRMVYTDQILSPDEKLAASSKYSYIDSDDPIPSYQQQQPQMGPSNVTGPTPPVPATWSQQQQPYYPGPPPLVPPPMGSPYANALPCFVGSPHPPTPMPGHGGYPASQSLHVPPLGYGSPQPSMGQHVVPTYSGPPPGFPPPASSSAVSQRFSGSPAPAQSYPAYPPGAQPPANNPEANTAEALACTNSAVVAQNAQTAVGGKGQREADLRGMEQQAEGERTSDEVSSTPAVSSDLPPPAASSTTPSSPLEGNSSSGRKAAQGRRTKAADLF